MLERPNKREGYALYKKTFDVPSSLRLPSPHQSQNQLAVLYQEVDIHPTLCSSPQTRDASPVTFKTKHSKYVGSTKSVRNR